VKGLAGEILVTATTSRPPTWRSSRRTAWSAVVTAAGSALSHSAILARSLHLPLVVGASQAAA
jgi:phosphotransferase system enzyme I (PtsI)